MSKRTTKMDLISQDVFFCQRQAFRVLSLGYKLQHYVVRETTAIYKTMISLDGYISFASTDIRETN